MVDFTWHEVHFHLSNAMALLALGGMVLAAVVMFKQFTAQKKQARMFETYKSEPARFMGQPGTQASRW